ncbi:putative peptidoglycan binding protein [Algoriphagus boseongensis]|uniref:Putative peptidoglycan binding protein n=1 Tax=Algoriphagus boseongensis TaxID=1442587 RepID=A0A4R6TBZ4_9BACT|nr:N-acetylmuramidase family protein [Algoriphagus boseongensis]TDQ19205.1 putative peptidoglycan binding protein [Algoriphagus boseongensis]
MQYLKLRSRGEFVSYLQELLTKLGYEIPATGYFGNMTDAAVRDFQKKNDLVVDGEVGIKTWTVLIEKTRPAQQLESKFLGEGDLKDFASRHNLELAAVKAVNEVESSGKGFLVDGRPKILFEGHEFWKQLKARGINPASISNASNSDVLYSKWTKVHYIGGTGEYSRLEKAIALSPDPRFKEAALASTSWGSYQIMGYHATKLGYPTVQAFVDEMYQHERNQLKAFGKYIEAFGCINHLRSKNWAKFAYCYNGPQYAQNKYDVKMANAYKKYQA